MSFSDVKDRVKEATDIVEVASRYLRLKKAGKNYLALCPFHREKTPSFSINPQGGFFYCFGCGRKGDVFTLVMEMEGMTFPEALAMLAERLGIDVKPEGGGDAERAADIAKGRENLMRLNAAAARFFHNKLIEPADSAALEYLRGRGFSDEIIEAFDLGYAPDSWDDLVRFFDSRNVNRKWLVSAGLARQGSDGEHRDYFRNRIVFPVRNTEGRVIAFGARALADDDQPKYLNSPDTPVFKKSRTLFGLDLARREIGRRDTVLVMEGYTDVMMAHQGGLTHAVATLGTAFSEDAASVLKRLADSVVLIFDGDEAGRKAARRALQILLGTGIVPKLLLLPAEHDPCSFIRDNGGETFIGMVEAESVDGFSWLLRETAGSTDMSSPHQRAAAARDMAEFVSSCGDPLLKETLIDALAETFRVSRPLVAGAAAETRYPERTDTTAEEPLPPASLLDRARVEFIAAAAEEPSGLVNLETGLDFSLWPSDMVDLVRHMSDAFATTGLTGEDLLAHLMSERRELGEVLLPAVGAPAEGDGGYRLKQAALGLSRAAVTEKMRRTEGAEKFDLRRALEEIDRKMKNIEVVL